MCLVCLSVSRRIPTLLHEPGCKLGEGGRGALQLCTIGRFAIGAQVLLLWQHSAELEMSVSTCTHSMPGLVCFDTYVSNIQWRSPVSTAAAKRFQCTNHHSCVPWPYRRKRLNILWLNSCGYTPRVMYWDTSHLPGVVPPYAFYLFLL